MNKPFELEFALKDLRRFLENNDYIQSYSECLIISNITIKAIDVILSNIDDIFVVKHHAGIMTGCISCLENFINDDSVLIELLFLHIEVINNAY